MNRKQQLLGGLLLVLLLSLGYGVMQWPRQERVGTTPTGGRSALSPAKDRSTSQTFDEDRLRIDLLEGQAGAPRQVRRNLFERGLPPAPEKVVIKVEPPPLPPPPPPVVVEEPLPPPEPQVQLARFKFLGYLEKDLVKTIFLSSEGGVFVVKKGDRFGMNQEFQVLALSPNELRIRQGADPREIIVPLSENSPLVPRPAAAARTPAGSGGGFVPLWRSQAVPPPEVPEVTPPPVVEQNTLSTEGAVHGPEN